MPATGFHGPRQDPLLARCRHDTWAGSHGIRRRTMYAWVHAQIGPDVGRREPAALRGHQSRPNL
jgi:hypothetical protein